MSSENDRTKNNKARTRAATTNTWEEGEREETNAAKKQKAKKEDSPNRQQQRGEEKEDDDTTIVDFLPLGLDDGEQANGICNKIKEKQKEIGAIETAIAREQKEIDKMEAEIAREQNQIDNMEVAIAREQKEIQNMEAEIQNIEKEQVTHKTEMDDTVASPNLDPLPKRKDDLTAALFALLERKDALLERKDALLERKDALSKRKDEQVALQISLSKRKDEQVAVSKQLSQLHISFRDGEYYASASSYLASEVVGRDNGCKWQQFVREYDGESSFIFACRKRSPNKATNTSLKSTANRNNDPYRLTRKGAMEGGFSVPKSGTARTSCTSQRSKTVRDGIWPTDVFGNDAGGQEIAHLIPGGKTHVNQWLNVAAAACGISSSADLDVKKKATRGYIDAEKKSSSEVKEDEQNSESRTNQTGKRAPESGVVHFVSNKIRLNGQEAALDGPKPTCWIVPVMSLNNAKAWRGEAYKAICFVGHPRNGAFGFMDCSSVYKNIHLCQRSLTTIDYTRDATTGELALACQFLRDAVLGLQDMIANLSEKEIEASGDKKTQEALRVAHVKAKNETECKVPQLIADQTGDGRKPVCLITFGEAATGELKHPPPDPLLLVTKAANIFGIMSGMKMLANADVTNGDDYDDNVSIRDIMAEEAFLESRERSYRPTTWDDLAKGLGQPNGYVECA